MRLACHPHDPYTPPGYRGVTRVLGTVEGLKRFVQMHESPYHGLNFCQGTVAEMLDDPAREIFDVIRWFGERGKIFNVHFRNIKGRKLDFMEAFPDEGDMDMPRALAAYRERAGHVHVALVRERLHEVELLPLDVAEMHVEDLAALAEPADHVEDLARPGRRASRRSCPGRN